MKNNKYNNIENRPEIICSNYAKDKIGHKISIAKCPHCCNFFTARADLLKRGNTKSCGCLKYKKTPNTYYFPLYCNFAIGYFDNTDKVFIFDADKYDIVSLYHWSDKNAGERHEPITTVNGKTTSMARLLMDTPEGLVCDHINGNPCDNRVENLRNCTYSDNSHNQQGANNKDEYGEFSFEKSQKIAKRIETHQFDNIFCLGSVLEEINSLSEKNIHKIILRNICRNKANGYISDDNAASLLLQLIKDYTNRAAA